MAAEGKTPIGGLLHGGGWACRRTRDQGRRLTSPDSEREPDKPAASTGGPAGWFRRGNSLRRHPRNARSTLLRDGPAFFTALFTLGDARRAKVIAPSYCQLSPATRVHEIDDTTTNHWA